MKWTWGRKAHIEEAPAEVLPLMPVMDEGELVRQLKAAQPGTAVALLQYAEDSLFELVGGSWYTLTEADEAISYWVGDRLVALMGKNGDPVPVPALLSLRPNFEYPVSRLTREVIGAA